MGAFAASGGIGGGVVTGAVFGSRGVAAGESVRVNCGAAAFVGSASRGSTGGRVGEVEPFVEPNSRDGEPTAVGASGVRTASKVGAGSDGTFPVGVLPGRDWPWRGSPDTEEGVGVGVGVGAGAEAATRTGVGAGAGAGVDIGAAVGAGRDAGPGVGLAVGAVGPASDGSARAGLSMGFGLGVGPGRGPGIG